MAREILIVGDILSFVEGKLIIAIVATRESLRRDWRNTDIDDLKAQFEGKKIKVFGEGYQFETDVLSVQVKSSIVENKNVFLLVDKTPSTQKIKINDEVEIEL
jgi:hypothetical protein